MKECLLLVFANKQDIPGCESYDRLAAPFRADYLRQPCPRRKSQKSSASIGCATGRGMCTQGAYLILWLRGHGDERSPRLPVVPRPEKACSRVCSGCPRTSRSANSRTTLNLGNFGYVPPQASFSAFFCSTLYPLPHYSHTSSDSSYGPHDARIARRTSRSTCLQ